MTQLASGTKYATAIEFLKESDANLAGSGEDAVRCAYYQLCEDMYHNRPETFQVRKRGDEETPSIYLPSARKIIEATNRFLAVDFGFVVDPDATRGSDEERATIQRMLDNLFKRERLYTKFDNNKRYGLVRGDAMFHVTADPTKEPEKRISIHVLNPGNAFAILDPVQEDRVLGWHIVDTIQDPREDDPSKLVARRLTYLKSGVTKSSGLGYEQVPGSSAGPGPITSETTYWTVGKWDDRNMKAEDMESVPGGVPLTQLPPSITSLPVYHWRNNAPPNETYGLSEISGLETIIAALNQSITDEDLTLVLQGLGVYATTASPPQDGAGNPTSWEMGPGQIIELGADDEFKRVSGVSTVAPFQDHMKFMGDEAMIASGIPDIAAGRVDVTVAESGISLQLQLAPLLAKNAEKEQEILDICDHMLYDICTQWFPGYEAVNAELTSAASVVGDPMPFNRDAKIQEVLLLFTSGLITIEMAQAELSKLGYTFRAGDNVQVLRDAQALAGARGGDDVANRYSQELENRPAEQVGNPVSTPPPVSAPAPGATLTV